MFSPLSVHALTCALILYVFIEIDGRGMLCFVSMQHLMYPSLFWWNLSSASIASNIFVFLPLTSFFDMFADLTYLTISSLSLKCVKACVIGLAGHFILKIFIDIPNSVIGCSTSGSVVSLWNPVATSLPWLWPSCVLWNFSGIVCSSPSLLVESSIVSIFLSWVSSISPILLYLSSLSSLNFSNCCVHSSNLLADRIQYLGVWFSHHFLQSIHHACSAEMLQFCFPFFLLIFLKHRLFLFLSFPHQRCASSLRIY